MATVTDQMKILDSLFEVIENGTLYSETGGIPECVFEYLDTVTDDPLSRKLRDIISKNRLNGYGEIVNTFARPLPSTV
tara:strand:- start:1 stop:234 length:234 start_codon:yes stop_codon:yes gene_type:complete